jgi:hypothetical protein
MKYYATLLNLKYANMHSLNREDIFDPRMQEDILHRMIWGSGKTENESLQDAIKNLTYDCIIETYECEEGAKGIVEKLPGKEALSHLWLYFDEYGDEPKLCSVPCHNAFVDFCMRYNLPKEAQQELASFFNAITHIDG